MSLVWSWVSPISSEIILTISFFVTLGIPYGAWIWRLAWLKGNGALD